MFYELHIFGLPPESLPWDLLRRFSAEPLPPSRLFSPACLHSPACSPGSSSLPGSSDAARDLSPDRVQGPPFDRAEPLAPSRSFCPSSGPQEGVPGGYSDGVRGWLLDGLCSAEERRRLLEALLVPVREARATLLLRAVGAGIRGVAFDLEGTLTELEFVDALAERLGFGARMRRLTRDSMTGRTPDFRRDYEARMAALRGVGVSVMEEVIGSMTLAPGVASLCARLHAAAIPTAIISGGCSRLGEAARKKIAARALYATVWAERLSRFTGRAASSVIDPVAKVRALEDFARTISVPLTSMAAVGDGANDLGMLSSAGTALLTHASAVPPWPAVFAAILTT